LKEVGTVCPVCWVEGSGGGPFFDWVSFFSALNVKRFGGLRRAACWVSGFLEDGGGGAGNERGRWVSWVNRRPGVRSLFPQIRCSRKFVGVVEGEVFCVCLCGGLEFELLGVLFSRTRCGLGGICPIFLSELCYRSGCDSFLLSVVFGGLREWFKLPYLFVLGGG